MKPMSEAPRDGRKVLLVWGENTGCMRYSIGSWVSSPDGWYLGFDIQYEEKAFTGYYDLGELIEKASEWAAHKKLLAKYEEQFQNQAFVNGLAATQSNRYEKALREIHKITRGWLGGLRATVR